MMEVKTHLLSYITNPTDTVFDDEGKLHYGNTLSRLTENESRNDVLVGAILMTLANNKRCCVVTATISQSEEVRRRIAALLPSKKITLCSSPPPHADLAIITHTPEKSEMKNFANVDVIILTRVMILPLLSEQEMYIPDDGIDIIAHHISAFGLTSPYLS